MTTYRDALQENTRDRVPLEWAYSEHGLANALALLAKQEKSAARMREAITCMEGAAAEYQKAGETYWLPRAQRRIAEMNADMSELQ